MSGIELHAEPLIGKSDSQSCQPTAQRQKTMPPSTGKSPRTSPETVRNKTMQLGNDRLKSAKLIAEEAIKNRKIFTIQGPYPFVRESLRNRGWVEQFYKADQQSVKPVAAGKKQKEYDNSSSDSDDDVNDCVCDGDGNPIDVYDYGGQIAPWEEENGFYGITSRLVKHATPSFIWGVRRDCVDPKSLSKDQLINHYGHASFTTKVGLCVHLRDLPWYEQAHSDTFFPRCYRLSHEEDKGAFVDDYVLTAAVSILKHVVAGSDCDDDPNSSDEKPVVTKQLTPVPALAITTAMEYCQQYIRMLDHDDLDSPIEEPNDEKTKDRLVQWHYKIVLENTPVSDVDKHRSDIFALLVLVREHCPQFDLDGTRNVWIVKPGAKSRGRGIQCYNRLEEILKLVTSLWIQKDSKFVIQKYIERPLLIHKTKFDIRQWFVVTDWNPFTMWFYKDCYLRFCSQEYTLTKLHESIHLSNNSIQKNYKNGQRSSELPEENMWHCEEFKAYLKERGLEGAWDNKIYPGMKDAVTYALLCCQDVVEQRKNTFELYGADFMLTEDCNPWLIEINSSPCMAPSTKVTAMMCRSVLEDTVRIVLDRKTDKNADTGLFELAYRQPVVTVPQYVGINLQVEGQPVKKPTCAPLSSRKPATAEVNQERSNCEVAAHLSKTTEPVNRTTKKILNKTVIGGEFSEPADSTACKTQNKTYLPSANTNKTQNRSGVDLANRHKILNKANSTDSTQSDSSNAEDVPSTKKGSVKVAAAWHAGNTKQLRTDGSAHGYQTGGHLEFGKPRRTSTNAERNKIVLQVRQSSAEKKIPRRRSRRAARAARHGHKTEVATSDNDIVNTAALPAYDNFRAPSSASGFRRVDASYSASWKCPTSAETLTSGSLVLQPRNDAAKKVARNDPSHATATTGPSVGFQKQSGVPAPQQCEGTVRYERRVKVVKPLSVTSLDFSRLGSGPGLSISPAAASLPFGNSMQDQCFEKVLYNVPPRPADHPLPSMPYFASRPVGGRRLGTLPADALLMSKIKYSHGPPEMLKPRKGSRQDLLQLQRTMNITSFGSYAHGYAALYPAF